MEAAKLASGVSWTVGTVAATLGAWSRWLAWKSSGQLPAEKQARREWHTSKWQKIKDSRTLQLPERVIRSLVRARTSLSEREFSAGLMLFQVSLPTVALVFMWLSADQLTIARIPHAGAFVFAALVLSIASILSTLCFYAVVDEPGGIVLLIPITCLTLLGVGFCTFDNLDARHQAAVLVFVFSVWAVSWFCIAAGRFQENPKQPSISFAVAWMLISALSAYIQYPLLKSLEMIRLGPAALARMLFLLPLATYGIGLLPARIAVEFRLARRWSAPDQVHRIYDSCILFGLSVGISYFVSLAAMFIGHALSPLATIPQTARMLLSNALFDASTVVMSLYILERAVAPRIVFTIPTALLLNLVLGAAFACASLWLGVRSLTLIQVLRVLTGHSIDGQYWEFGPTFWVMHSTFLPLLFYLFFVLLCWAAKAFLHQRQRFHGKAKELDGLSMSASFLGLVSALLALASILVRSIV